MKTPADLFQTTQVWTVHLRFTREQWTAMEPVGGSSMWSLFLGGGGGGRGDFGMGMFLAPAVMRAGDRDASGTLSQAEFRGVAEQWFADWAKGGDGGALDRARLRDGLNAVMGPAQGGGGGFEMSLQGGEGKRNGIASMLGTEFAYVHADLEFDEQRLADVAVRYKGNGTFLESRGSLKRSLKIDLNKYVKGQKLAGGVTTLNLHNNVTDPGWLNEVLAYRLYRDAGVPAPRTAYARVYVTVPGLHDRKYFGLYSLVENVDKHFLAERFSPRGGGASGVLLKPSATRMFAYLGNDWARYVQTYDPKTALTDAQKRRVIEFCRLVSTADDAAFDARVGEYVDLEAFARYMAVLVWLGNPDSLLLTGQNFYLYLDPATDKFHFIPWDQDHSFGHFAAAGLASQETLNQLGIDKPWAGDKRFLAGVFRSAAFKKAYLDRLAEFSRGIFQPARLDAQVAEVAGAIRPAVQDESPSKLAEFDAIAAGKSPPKVWLSFVPPKQTIRQFVKLRGASVEDQLAGRSEGRPLGGGRGVGGAGGGRNDGRLGEAVARALVTALDADHDQALSKDEFVNGFGKWFAAWDAEGKSELTEAQLRKGMNKALPFRFPGAGGARGGAGTPPPPPENARP